MKITVVPVHESLKQDVECVRIVEHTGEDDLAINVCLNGSPGIAFHHYNGRSPLENITTRSGPTTGAPTLFVYGQMTEPGVMNHKKGPFTTTQMILKPHALHSLLGLNASVLTNALVELTEFSARDLDIRLMEARCEQERLNLLTDFLLAKQAQVNARDRLVEESLRLVHTNIDCVTVKYLLECLNISERQFERRFIQAVGLRPQFYIRVKRFNQAVNLMKNRQFGKLTELAHALNYYDQSHFIRDLKSFSGITPTCLFQKVDDFQLDQGVYAYMSA